MYQLFNSFELNDIPYLHFKSNTNLSKSFEGRADFDVLVDKNRISDIERLIIEHHGKRHNPAHIGVYPGVDNWLVFDEESGKIYHLHLHYQLATGKHLVKDYIIPWDDLLFATRKKDPEFDIYITDPNLELLLLAFRNVLKSRFLDFAKKLFGCYKLGKAMQLEWNDLSKKASPDEIKKFADIVCPDHSIAIIEILSKKDLTSRDYLKLHRYVRRVMAVHRRYGCFEATLRSSIYKRITYFRKIWSRKMDGLSITKKTSLQGGLIIAFVGIDGAGKSTLSNGIAKWISAGKIECKRFYMGVGDGKTTFFISFIKQLSSIKGKKVSKHNPGTNQNKIPSDRIAFIPWYRHPLQYIKTIIRILQINSVQKNNFKKICQMYRYKLNGGISVLDRWPQVEIAGRNDGPKMGKYKDAIGIKGFMRTRIAKEQKYLRIVKTIKPDIIFRLNISLDTCMNRKDEHKNRSAFERKLNELNQLEFQGANIIEINAEQPFDEEFLEIKKILWKYI